MDARLGVIEARLGILSTESRAAGPSVQIQWRDSAPVDDDEDEDDVERPTGLPDLSSPLYRLMEHARGEVSDGLQTHTVEALWLA